MVKKIKKEEPYQSFLERDFGMLDYDILFYSYPKTNLSRLFEQIMMQHRHYDIVEYRPTEQEVLDLKGRHDV